MSGISVNVKSIETTDRSCVGDQPQQVTVSGGASKVYTAIWSFLRLVLDTAAVRLFQLAPAQ